jgi:hypothetical protein
MCRGGIFPASEGRSAEQAAMISFLPIDVTASALEMACYVFTVAAALLSCLVTLR